MRTLPRAFSIIAGALLTVLATAAPASAVSTASSIWSTYTVIGIPYKNQAVVSNATIMTGYVNVARTDGGTIPAGWSSGQASLYLNGALCSSAAMTYYPYETPSWSGGTTFGNCGHGNYTTRGSTGAYNGSGYNYYYTATSPILAY